MAKYFPAYEWENPFEGQGEPELCDQPVRLVFGHPVLAS
jgi:hypothetical protein